MAVANVNVAGGGSWSHVLGQHVVGAGESIRIYKGNASNLTWWIPEGATAAYRVGGGTWTNIASSAANVFLSTAGTYEIRLSGTIADGDTDSYSVQVDVYAGFQSTSVTYTGDISTIPDVTAPDVDVTFVVSQLKSVVLPEGSGGTAPLTYALLGTLPAGLAWTASTRTLGGTPTTAQAATDHTYRVTESGGDTADGTVSIKVVPTSSYLLDQIENREGEVRRELQRLCQTGQIHVFVDGVGRVVAQDRSARTGGSSLVAIPSILREDAKHEQDERRAPNTCRVVYHPRSLDTGVTLWTLSDAVRIAASGSLDIDIEFSDPEERTRTVAGDTLVTAEVAGNVAQDGTGADKTSSLTATVTSLGPTWGRVTVANADSSDVWMTAAKVQGTIYRSYQAEWKESVSDADVSATGERRLEHVAPYLLDGASAVALADELVAIYAGDRAETPRARLRVTTADRALTGLNPGDTVTLPDGTEAAVEAIGWTIEEDVPWITMTFSQYTQRR